MWTEWSTAQIALVISGLSFGLSFANFIWSIRSKYIHPKPKARVWADMIFSHMPTAHSASIMSDGRFAGDFPPNEMSHPAISLEVTNFGPTDLTVTMCLARIARSNLRKLDGHGAIMPYRDYPSDLDCGSFANGKLPKSLKPAESHRVFLAPHSTIFDQSKFVARGFSDSFSRQLWITPENMKKLRKQYDAAKRLQA
jgi:hypothetical protein